MDKILIIEDDPDIAAIERNYLELSGSRRHHLRKRHRRSARGARGCV